MRTTTTGSVLVALAVILGTTALHAATLDGTLKLGGVILDETGDLSTVQETYNIYDGFSVTQIRLNGTLNPRNHFMLNLREINLDGRQGNFLYRVPGTFELDASFDQHRQVFDRERGANAKRKDWRFGARLTPVKWVRINGSFNYRTRDGDRLSFPPGTSSVLGDQYDYALRSGSISAEARKDRRGIAVAYRISDFDDGNNVEADRTAHVVSARAFAPSFFYDKWTHLLRGAYGMSKLSSSGIDYTLLNFQYTGVGRLLDPLQFKYNLEAQRIDNESTGLKTDRFHNHFDATFFHQYGNVWGGYGYEINDDGPRPSNYHSWRAGAALRYLQYATAKLRYAGRVKTDTEELTLLKDIEASRFRGDLDVHPVEGLTIGGRFNVRDRDYPSIDVKSKGRSVSARGHYSRPAWGGLSGDYTYTKDEYTDRAGSFDTNSHVVTGRVDLERIPNLRLSGGVTYMDVGEDLDIEKYTVFLEGGYTVLDDFHVEVKYNIYNYDDYLILDRYYTADVVWFNVAYDLHVE
jgi:hypothetical protein